MVRFRSTLYRSDENGSRLTADGNPGRVALCRRYLGFHGSLGDAGRPPVGPENVVDIGQNLVYAHRNLTGGLSGSHILTKREHHLGECRD